MDDANGARWQVQDRQWREPAEAVGFLASRTDVDRALLAHRTVGPWWDVLEATGTSLLVSREYEHLLLSLAVRSGRPEVTYHPMPHPSGIAYDAQRGIVHVACTRNPNQVLELMPTWMGDDLGPLVAVRARFHPGGLYLHDLAMIAGELYGNAAGRNCVVRLRPDRPAEPVWWPACVDGPHGPDLERNYLQLNSIAAGPSLAGSSFSASASRPSARRPGHKNFAVDGRGVIFDGRSRQVSRGGLTRPHSARVHDGDLWVDNSGYGQLLRARGVSWETVCELPGWTRGLAFVGDVAFVGTSRVIPRFRNYAPGLAGEGTCGIHAVDSVSGRVLAAMLWPAGNQVFAIEPVPQSFCAGLPGRAGRRSSGHESAYYSLRTREEA